MEVYGLKNIYGKVRIDNRWDKSKCIKKCRKSEIVVKFRIEEIKD